MNPEERARFVGMGVLMVFIIALAVYGLLVMWNAPQPKRIGMWVISSLIVDGVDYTHDELWVHELEGELNYPYNYPDPIPTTTASRGVSIMAWSYIHARGYYASVATLRFPNGRVVAGFSPAESWTREPLGEPMDEDYHVVGYGARDLDAGTERHGQYWRRQTARDAVFSTVTRAFQEPLIWDAPELRYKRGTVRGLGRTDDLWPVLAAGYVIEQE